MKPSELPCITCTLVARDFFHASVLVCSIRLDPLWLCDTNVEKDIRCRIRFIRVAYTIPRNPSRMQREPLNVMQVPFIPTQFERAGCCSESHYETLPLTMDRIINWLNSTG